MNSRGRFTSWVAWGGAMVGAASTAVAQDCGPDFRWADLIAQTAVQSVPLTGAVFIVEQHGQVLYQRTYGSYAVDQVVHSASAGKWISACIVMSVVGDGLLSLDSTTGDVLGWQDAEGAITLRQLFSHTSGYTDGSCEGDGTSTLEACAESIHQELDPVFPPGTGFYYGGAGMQVAARMCEVATGTPWAQLFAERLRDPLGWTTTVYINDTNPRIAAGNYTNGPEYMRMLRMMLDGGVWNGVQVLTPQAVAQMLSDQTNGASVVYAPPTATEFLGYGMGNWIMRRDGESVPVDFSSPGAFGLNPWIDEQRDVAAVFVVQNLNLLVSPYVAYLRQAVRDAIDFPVPVADANLDGVVDTSDFNVLATHFGMASGATKWDGDFTGDGKVDSADFNVLAAGFGTACP